MGHITTRDARLRRHRRVRGKVHGTAERPRLSVARSNLRIYAQLIDDDKGHTVAAAGSHEVTLKELSKGPAAIEVGKLIAERGKAAGVTRMHAVIVGHEDPHLMPNGSARVGRFSQYRTAIRVSPLGGAVGPAALRGAPASRAANEPTSRRPRAHSSMVPTSTRTI